MGETSDCYLKSKAVKSKGEVAWQILWRLNLWSLNLWSLKGTWKIRLNIIVAGALRSVTMKSDTGHLDWPSEKLMKSEKASKNQWGFEVWCFLGTRACNMKSKWKNSGTLTSEPMKSEWKLGKTIDIWTDRHAGAMKSELTSGLNVRKVRCDIWTERPKSEIWHLKSKIRIKNRRWRWIDEVWTSKLAAVAVLGQRRVTKACPPADRGLLAHTIVNWSLKNQMSVCDV